MGVTGDIVRFRVRADPLLTPHTAYSSLGASVADRLVSYRALIRLKLDVAAISERATGQQREVQPHGRPLKP